MKRPTHLLAAGVALTICHAAVADQQAQSANQDTSSQQSIQSQIDALTKEVAALKQAQQSSRPTTQEPPRLTKSAKRAAITGTEGSSSVAFPGLVQADTADYDQGRARPLAMDFRRGSVGGAGNREINGARDLSSGIYFRRARLGLE